MFKHGLLLLSDVSIHLTASVRKSEPIWSADFFYVYSLVVCVWVSAFVNNYNSLIFQFSTSHKLIFHRFISSLNVLNSNQSNYVGPEQRIRIGTYSCLMWTIDHTKALAKLVSAHLLISVSAGKTVQLFSTKNEINIFCFFLIQAPDFLVPQGYLR